MIRTDFVIKTVNFERIESKMDKLEDIPLIHIKEGSKARPIPVKSLTNFMRMRGFDCRPTTPHKNSNLVLRSSMKTHYSDCKVTGKEEEKVPEKIIIVNEDSNPEIEEKFDQSIRGKNLEDVQEVLDKHYPSCLEFSYKISIALRPIGKVPDEIEYDAEEHVTLVVAPIHLAIMGNHSDIVSLILKKISQAENSREVLMKVASNQPRLLFPPHDEPPSRLFYFDDISMDGMTTLHLAAKYSPKSLDMVLRFLRRSKLDYSNLIKAGDHQVGMTPLHVAANYANPSAVRALLEHGAKVDAIDKLRGYTPLHLAAKSSNEEVLLLLLEKGANPNALGTKKGYQKTPLHRARTAKSTRILLSFGGNKYISSCNNETPFEIMIKRNPQAAEEILNDSIKTNDQELDSNELMIIYDLDTFFQNRNEPANEMYFHSMVVNEGLQDMLKHPLLEGFLHLKWSKTKKYFFINIAFFTAFLACLTSLATLQTMMLYCGTDSSRNICKAPNDTIVCRNGFLEIQNIHYLDENCSKTIVVFFELLYILTTFGTAIIALRELAQATFSWSKYSRSKENLMEWAMILGTAIYLLTLHFNMDVARHAAAWSIFFGWIEMTLTIGRFPSVGIYIFMSVHVMKTVVTILMFYIPVLLAFTFSFHILISNKTTFDNPLTAFLKILTMMTGEMDFEDNFTFEAVRPERSVLSTQIMYVLFLFFVSIIIANLLIGLTVNKTEVLFKEAGIVRLNKTVLQIVAQEDILTYSTKILPMPKSRRQDCLDGLSIEKFLNSYKKCASKKEHDIYIFNESTDKKGTLLPMKIPGWIIMKTMRILKNRASHSYGFDS